MSERRAFSPSCTGLWTLNTQLVLVLPYNGPVASRRSVPSGLLGRRRAGRTPALAGTRPLSQRQAPSFRDQGDFFFPLKLYTADRLLAGEIPLWNPLLGTGEPWLANGQSGVFYPPTSLLPAPLARPGRRVSSSSSTSPWAPPAPGSFCAKRRSRLRRRPWARRRLAGCGFAASLSAYWNHFGAWAWLPWIAFFARERPAVGRLAGGPGGGRRAAGDGGQPGAFRRGDPPGADLRVATPAREPDWSDPPRRRRLLVCAAAAGLGLALAGWVLVPMAELACTRTGAASLRRGERESGAVGLWSRFLGARPLSGRERNRTTSLPLHAGPLLLCAAAGAFTERQRRRLALLLGRDRAGRDPRLGGRAPGIVASLDPSARPDPLSGQRPGLDVLRAAGPRGNRRGQFPVRAGPGSLAPRPAIGARRIRFSCSFPAGRPAERLLEAAGIAALLARRRPGVAASAADPGLPRSVALRRRCRGARRLRWLCPRGPCSATSPEEEIRRVPPAIPFLAHVRRTRRHAAGLDTLSRGSVGGGRYDAAALRRQRQSLLGYTNLLAGVSTVRTAGRALSAMGSARSPTRWTAAPDPTLPAGAAAGRVLWTPFQPADLGSRKVDEFFRAPINPYRPRLSFVSGFRIEPDPSRAWSRAARGGDGLVARGLPGSRAGSRRPAAAGSVPTLSRRIAQDLPEKVAADVNSDGSGDPRPGGSLVSRDGRPTVDGQPAADPARRRLVARGCALSRISPRRVLRTVRSLSTPDRPSRCRPWISS